MRFFAGLPAYHGLSWTSRTADNADEAYMQFVQALYAEMHARNLRLYVNIAHRPTTPTEALRSQLRRTADHELRRARGGEPTGRSRRKLVHRQPQAVMKSVPRKRSSALSAITATTGQCRFPTPKTRSTPSRGGRYEI